MRLNNKRIFLLLTVLVAVLYVWPDLNYQPLLAQGDHGRDLYAFNAVMHGQLPYKDFWWVYGPIMPYYYGLFFKLFGVHITSVLLGRALMAILCSVFFYLAAACLMSPGLAFLAAAWFTQSRQEFFFTYNHIGGIVAELVIAWCLLSYIKMEGRRYLWIALIADFILGLVKINFGLAGLVGLVLSVIWIDFAKKYPFDGQKKKFYRMTYLLLPLGWAIIYFLLLYGLPIYAIRQCMPYLPQDHPFHASPLLVIPYYLMQNWLTFIHSPVGVAIGIVLHGCTLLAVYLLATKKMEKTYRQDVLLALAVIGIFFVLYFHEFLVSGVWYRTYWSQPFETLFHFVMIAVAFTVIPRVLNILVLIFLWGLVALGVVVHTGSIQSQKQPFRYLSMKRGQIYVGNEPQWTNTVNTVTSFLNATLKKNDYFFALPYDCLYYYLTGKESPTRQLIFFDHINIPREQEISVIKDLESHKVGYVLMSNRIISDEKGLGIFGKTYCPLLAIYIYKNYAPLVRQGGDWTKPPGWANNHGVIIFKRKTPFI
ncbi:MAG: hypothetical protein KGJ09_07530 [Candidatus Omnitrophica bacterium]|nr:hypothetical protein [Candidatus Omnitrophota bacterium]MDE2009911.1 hypothetical protein [Candidatus Omnitrophota bacterium]MDE2214999.1 hypothetical protein [Candidatus Omnitrophota bacterium]MDE2232116.1 hypothetical protein [Candidatus Omnitrophota bacterium]